MKHSGLLWRGLVAASAVMLSLTLSFAIAEAIPANANGGGEVLPENTAEYTFSTTVRQNQQTDWGDSFYYFPWIYNEATNSWSNGSREITPTGQLYAMSERIRLDITKGGKVSFELVCNKVSDYISDGCFLWKQNSNDESSRVDYFTDPDMTDPDMRAGRWSADKFLPTETFTIDVEAGDIVCLYISNGSTSSYNDFEIRGLKPPQEGFLNQQFSFTAKAEEHGTVSCDGQTGETVSGTFSYSEKKTVRAIPEDGYVFSCWKDQYGNVMPDEEELTPRQWNETYTAEFIKEGIQYDPEEWTFAEAENTYTSNVKTASQEVTLQEVTLTVAFYGNSYLFFDYLLPKSSNINVVLDGKYRCMTYGIWYDDTGDGSTWEPFSYQIDEERERSHRLEICFKVTGSSIDQIKIRGIRAERDPATTTMSVQYNEKYADVYVFPMIEYRNLGNDQNTGVSIGGKGSPYIVEENRLASGTPKTVVAGLRYAVVGIAKVDVSSSIDPSQTAVIVFSSLSTEKGDTIQKAVSDVLFRCFDVERRGDVVSATFTEGKIDYLTANATASSSVNGSVIQMNFEEVAPTPEVSVMVTAGGTTEAEKPLKNGETLYLPFGESNSVNVVLNDFPVEEDYVTKTTFGGQTLQELKIELRSDVDKLYFTLPANIQENKELVIGYGCEGYADSVPFVVHIRIKPEGTMGENLHYFGNIQIEDGGSHNGTSVGTAAWEFATDSYQGDSRYAYRAVMLDNTGATSSGYVSNLKLTVTGGGTLSFEIKMGGYGTGNTWLLYSFDGEINKNPTESGANTSSNGGKALLKTANTGFDQVTDVSGLEGVNLTPLGDNWYSVSVSLQVLSGAAVPEDTPTVFYLGYGVVNTNGLEGDFVIRNIGYGQGTSKITYGVKGEGGTVKVTSGSQDYSSAEEISDGSRLTFTVTENNGYEFYAWVDGEDNLISFDKTYTHFVDGDAAVYAVIAAKDSYKLRINGKFYGSLTDAIGDAKAGDQIVIIRDYEVKAAEEGEVLTIPQDVDLIVPIDEYGTYYVEGGVNDRVVWAVDSTLQYRKRLFTVGEGVTLNIKGAVYVGGTLHRPNQSAQAHTSGNYAELKLDGSVIVEKGGKFDTNGRVTGNGGITVQNGGSIYQPFLILDFSGGTNTSGLFTLNQTPFSRYAMINIQCKNGFTVEYGGTLYGHASLYALNTYTTIDQPFISFIGTNASGEEGTTTLINLKKNAAAHVVYDDTHKKIEDVVRFNNTVDIGKTTIELTGGATAGFMTFPFGITTKDVHFSIPYNFDLILEADEKGENGDYELLYDYKLMPGATLWVKSDATLTLNANLLVYDGFYSSDMSGKSYPTAEDLDKAEYLKTANFIVDGSLVIAKRVVDIQKDVSGDENVTFLGVAQSTVAGATIDICETAVLKGTIIDGGLTGYDCNYASFDSTARFYNDATDTLTELTAGTVYTSVAKDGTWELPQFALTYARNCNEKEGEAAHKDFPEIPDNPLKAGRKGHVYDTKVCGPVEGMKGAWMIKHGEEHVFDWTPNDGEKPTAEDPVKTLTRECQVLGCTHKGSAHLLYKFDAITSQEYKGAAFSTEELVGLFKAMYKDKFPEGAEATVSFGAVAEVKNATTYTVTVGLTGASFLIGDALVSEGTFSFTVTPKAVSVKISDQSADYSGSEPNVSQTAFTFTDGEPFEGDTLGFVITKAEGKDCKAGGYEITAEESKGSNFANGNYTITITYTAEGHSVFTINKVTLKVTPDNFSSPEGEEPIGTFTAKISGFVNDADKEALEAGILAALRYTCGVTKESEQGTYDITVAYSGTLVNYDVDCTAKGRYTVTDPLFRGVEFKNTDAVTYDGNAHALEVTGHEALTNAKVVITYQKDGKPVEAENVKDAGEYEVTAVISAEGENGQTYTQTLEAMLTIEKLDVHVTLLAQSKTYDGAPASPDSGKDVGWKFTAEAFKLCGEDGTDVLGIRLSVEGGNKNAGKYTILTEKNENGNYNVIFDNDGKDLYSIEKKAVAVTIKDIGTTYGDGATKEAHAGDYEYDKSLIVSGDTVTVTLNFEGVDLSKANAAGYPVTASAAANNDNYTFTFTEGAKWTVAAKPVTVNVAKKTVTYSDTASPEAPTVWSLAEGSSLVAGDDLGVHLSKDGTGKDAGNYAIVATWDNKNYAVTFTGLTVEDNGGYVIEKLDISDDVFFFWEPDGSVTPDGTTTLRVKFAGQTVTLHCVGSYVDGNETLHGNLTATLDKPTVDALGTFTVTATIEDKNYSGSKAFTVIVTNAEGYTQELIEKLQRLGELAEGISADDLKAENFADLKEINGILNGLTEEEKEAAAKTLEEYEALVEAWEELADTDDIVETAKEIADAPIAAMFGAVAMLTALAGLAYIALKGGIL